MYNFRKLAYPFKAGIEPVDRPRSSIDPEDEEA